MYKIIKDNKVIDVVDNPCFVIFLPNNIIALSDKASAQGIASSDKQTLYCFEGSEQPDLEVVTIEKIDLDDFNRLQSLLNGDQVISADETELAKAKKLMIKHLSNVCNSSITTGFSIILSDGNSYSFKLTTEDQLNLLAIENQLNFGEDCFVYHATDKPCKVFSREDITYILKAYRKHITYHTTYFNVAKQYIKSLTDIDKVNEFIYGNDLTDFVKDRTLKNILLDGGVL